MDELASDVVVYGMVPQRRLLAASCGERCLSCCAPFDMLVSLACVWSVHACRRLQCRRDAWRLCLVSACLSAFPVSTCCVALCVVSGHGRGVSRVATQFVPVFLACCPVCLGRHAGEFFVAFLLFAAQTSV